MNFGVKPGNCYLYKATSVEKSIIMEEVKRKTTETSEKAEAKRLLPWVKPGILEEEEFDAVVLACASTKPACGVIVPRS